MKRDIEWYVEAAKKRTNTKSLNKLAPQIGITVASLSNLMRHRAYPADETMIKLAELAGVEPVKALSDLNMWRASSPAVLSVYQKMDKLLSRAAMLGLVLICSLGVNSGANAAVNTQNINAISDSVAKGDIYIITSIDRHRALSLPSG